jgi:hypothetical protein
MPQSVFQVAATHSADSRHQSPAECDIELDGEDMRRDPLSVRKATLATLLRMIVITNASALRQWSNARAIYSGTAAMHASNRCTTRFCHISALVLPRFAPLSDGCFALV